MKAVKIIMLITACFTIPFLLFSFSLWSVNPAEWTQDLRFGMCSLGAGMAFASSGYFLETTK